MKYLVNENNTCGQASLTDDLRNMVLEGMGYTVKKEEVSEQINESVAPQAEVEDNSDMPTLYEWDGSVFALDDEVFEIEGDLFLKAIELDSETRMSLDESHADLFINEVKFEQEDFSLGDIYDYGDEIFIKLDEGKKKGDKSKDKPEDKPDYTTDARKGDKSKTHAGEDFEDEDEEKKVKCEVNKPPAKPLSAAEKLANFKKNRADAGDTPNAQAVARRRTSELEAKKKAQNSDTPADQAQAERDAKKAAEM